MRAMEEKYLLALGGESMVKMKELLEMEPDTKVATVSVTKGATVGKEEEQEPVMFRPQSEPPKPE